jgi:hypothetical protein
MLCWNRFWKSVAPTPKPCRVRSLRWSLERPEERTLLSDNPLSFKCARKCLRE